jgi:hypothetical protein
MGVTAIESFFVNLVISLQLNFLCVDFYSSLSHPEKMGLFAEMRMNIVYSYCR